MAYHQSFKRLSETAELLKMIEQLIDSMLNCKEGKDSISWKGISLTLSQCRKNLMFISQQMKFEEIMLENSDAGGKSHKTEGSSPSLAERIRLAPVNQRGSVRMVKDNFNKEQDDDSETT